MDKLKEIIYSIFVKHLFWTLSVIILVMGVISWWTSAGELKTTYDENKKKINGTNTTVEEITNKPTEAVYNETTHDGMKAMNDLRRQAVYRAWRKKYDIQRSEVLVWPTGLSPEFDAFVEEIKSILDNRPIEEVNPVNADGSDRLTSNQRAEYRDRIKLLLPELAEMINAEWNPAEVAAGGNRFGGRGFGGRGGQNEFQRPPPRQGVEGEEEGGSRIEYAVNWNTGNQGQIQAERFDWSDSPDQLPTTLDILYSMEDYWVLKAVMQVIARTNTDEEFGLAELPHQAAIREIHFIDIGKNVESNVGEIYVPVSTSTTPGLEGEIAAPPPLRSQAEGEFGGAALEGGNNLAEGRYVMGPAGNYQPISAATLKSATESNNPAEAYLAVAKRMPVRMRVTIDQRKINKFLVECGNSDLMLEVKQVRINPDATEIISVAGGQGAAGGARGGGRGAGFGRGGGEGAGRVDAEGKSYPWDVEVEVYGIIYIFNPPSMKRLTAGLEPVEVDKFLTAVGEKMEETAKTTDDDLTVPAGEQPSGEAPAGEVPPGDKPADETPAAEAKANNEAAAPPPAG